MDRSSSHTLYWHDDLNINLLNVFFLKYRTKISVHIYVLHFVKLCILHFGPIPLAIVRKEIDFELIELLIFAVQKNLCKWCFTSWFEIKVFPAKKFCWEGNKWQSRVAKSGEYNSYGGTSHLKAFHELSNIMRSRIILWYIFPFDRFWPFLFEWIIQFVQVIRLYFKINPGIV